MGTPTGNITLAEISYFLTYPYGNPYGNPYMEITLMGTPMVFIHTPILALGARGALGWRPWKVVFSPLGRCVWGTRRRAAPGGNWTSPKEVYVASMVHGVNLKCIKTDFDYLH